MRRIRDSILVYNVQCYLCAADLPPHPTTCSNPRIYAARLLVLQPASKIMPLIFSEPKHPTTNVPKAMYISYAISIVSAFAVVCCAVSISPGIGVLRMTTTPLIFGFSEIFDMTPLQALSFTLIAKFATCLPYAFAYSVLISSLSKSGFMWRTSQIRSCTSTHNYLAGIFSGSIVGYGLNLLIWSFSKDNLWYLTRVYAILGFSVNLTIFVTYIVFKSKFSTLIKAYKSPVGINGAVYGLVMFVIVFISIGALEDPKDRWLVFVLLISFLLVWSAPYFLYYRHHLTYSEEESTIMFIAYIIKANQARRSQNTVALKKRTKTTPSPTTTPNRSKYNSNRTASDKSKFTFIPTVAARRAVEEGDSGRTGRVTPLCTSTAGSALPKDIEECGDVAAAAAVGTITSTTTAAVVVGEVVGGVGDEGQDVGEGLELLSVHAIPRSQRCPAPQSSSMHTNMSDIPEHSRMPNLSLHIDIASMSNLLGTGVHGDNKVVPVLESGAGAHTEAEEKVQNRGVSALDSVLTNNLRYDRETVGRIRTEIQEFYEAQQGEANEEV